jgi:hypothetical protein
MWDLMSSSRSLLSPARVEGRFGGRYIFLKEPRWESKARLRDDPKLSWLLSACGVVSL